METRTNHLFVGGFVLLLVAALVGFIIWTVKSDIEATSTKFYYTYFTGSVSGLSTASEVRYRGIPIGTVTDIRIDPSDVERVRVTLEIAAETPIKTDSVAAIEFQGITGVSFVQISGGSNAAPDLVASDGEEIPVLASRRSALEELFASTPELIENAVGLVSDVSALFGEENQTAIANTLAHLEILTGTLAANSGNIDLMIADASAVAEELSGAAAEIRAFTEGTRGDIQGLAGDARGLIQATRRNLDTLSQDLGLLIADIRGTADSLTRTSDEIGGLVAETREPFRDFSNDGLYDLTRLVAEMRTLVASLSRVSDQLESDAPGFLFGTDEEGFEAQ